MKVVSTEALTKLIQLVKSAFIKVNDVVEVTEIETETPNEVELATVATTGAYSDLIGALTAGSGIDITNNVISVTSPTLTNTATGSNSLTLLGTPTSEGFSINIGSGSSSHYSSIAIGFNAASSGDRSIVIGSLASASADFAIQLGWGTNSEANSFYVSTGYSSNNWKMLGSNGKIPNARINVDSTPTQDSTNFVTSGTIYSVLGDIETALHAINSGS